MLKEHEISKYILLTRLKWAGHAMKKDQEISKKILLSQPLGNREGGSPRLSYRKDEMDYKFQNRGMVDHDEWKGFLEWPKTQMEL